ncbi:PREDICTED: zinc finger CCCH domain-containing protein 15 [Tarenaya hassleriana]|uniref:zinc finger CCCH domain-containing protein 15 n=1 Tax=Tarenaya hassleriana TaxID=28532 RepID=UPI00053C6C3E|nr:PREDICTED: zinc finger CCCH domain-containing protein 15 [Tarenaya hassleriana]XP_010559235.1 PREDICTED: zinc finger CCCH domain-containing protein 15 [Tarenaya hassleriana]
MENEIAPITYGGSSASVAGIMQLQGEQSCGAVSPSFYSDQLYQSSREVMQQYQDMVNRHALCLTRLREASLEAESLRLQNSKLRSMNRELSQQLNLLIRSSVQSHIDYNTTSFQMLNELSNLSIGGNDIGEGEDQNRWDEFNDESPTSVMENTDLERSSLPKSISVRSSGYLKVSQGGGTSHVGKSRGATTKPGPSGQLSTTQKVYLRGGKKEDERIELEVYNQGMWKTELCNKWQETGACPYDDNCQFAHGIQELRPVIRHPRYKTEVCRMVLAGDMCPYGHRCHFRHALTEQEKLMSSFKAKPVKLN